MNNTKGTTIIAADYMYLVFLGNDETIGKMINKLNKHAENPQEKSLEFDKSTKSYKTIKNKVIHIYVKSEVNSPCIDMLEEDHIQQILVDDAVKHIKQNRMIKPLKLGSCDKTNEITEGDIDVSKKYVILDEGIETAQCLTYADVSSNDFASAKRKTPICDLMMIMVMIGTDSHYKLSYPILQLDEEANPDKLVSKWLSDHDISKDDVYDVSIRPVHIVGNEHDILVFSAFVNE
jgi:hypothetical protein